MSINIKDVRFNRLVAVNEVKIKGERIKWECVCDCGNIVKVDPYKLRSGHTKSCGCLQKEKIRNISKTHGATGTPLYNIWRGMRQRCFDKLATTYYKYGARGITICEEWLDFENFKKDMGESFKKGLSIDRIDNNSMYCKENCKWSTPTEQANNRRTSKIVTFKGKTDTLANLCRHFNVNYAMVQRRLVSGWSVEDAFLKPKQINQFN